MTSRIKKILSFRPLTVLAFLLTLCSCSDIDLQDPGVKGDDALSAIEGNTLSFSIRLGKDLSTRAETSDAERYDNYIDPDNFYLYFFDSKGNFLFQVKPAVSAKEDVAEIDYIARVDLSHISRDNEGYLDQDLVTAQLEKDDFKIAALVNWDQLPPWGWANSKLNPRATDIRNINDFHHLAEDGDYTKSGTPYTFIMNSKNQIGYNRQWVGARYEGGPSAGQANAETWIRTNWDPYTDVQYQNGTQSESQFGHYTNLWLLWNFGGSFDNTVLPYSSVGAENKASSWKSRNGNYFKTSQEWFSSNSFRFNQKDEYTYDGLTLVQLKTHSGILDTSSYIRTQKDTQNGRYGIVVPTVETPSTDKSGNPYVEVGKTFGYLKFRAPYSGNLRIKFSSLNANSTATIVVQRSSNFVTSCSTSGTNIVDFKDGSKTYQELKMTEEPEWIYIFTTEGTAVIYSIEFVCDIYLNETNRIGLVNTIPMYGVKQFEKISDWGNGTVNLSNPSSDSASGGETENTRSNAICLIRSVAKVVVLLPSDPEHIFLRSMNRKARLEPMDVESDTDGLWENHSHPASWPSSINDNLCEWYRIQAYGPGYDKNKTYVTEYQTWLSWFYGSWKSASWFPPASGSGAYTGWQFTGLTLPSNYSYPHIFNPDIVRSDFAHMLPAGKEGDLYKYVIYMPDKNIDDPNDAGNLSKTPKVAHIEYRYKGSTPYLDDNDCFRIYFTDYSTNNTIKQTQPDGYNDYEKGSTNGTLNISKHWPVMRNHIYKFTITGSGYDEFRVNAEVTNWNDNTNYHPSEVVW